MADSANGILESWRLPPEVTSFKLRNNIFEQKTVEILRSKTSSKVRGTSGVLHSHPNKLKYRNLMRNSARNQFVQKYCCQFASIVIYIICLWTEQTKTKMFHGRSTFQKIKYTNWQKQRNFSYRLMC
jgi:hypothetical protein